MMHTALYRHYDASGELLYVGCSHDALARFGQHRTYSAWAQSVVRIELEWFGSRVEALRAERAAIDAGEGIYNARQVHKPRQQIMGAQ